MDHLHLYRPLLTTAQIALAFSRPWDGFKFVKSAVTEFGSRSSADTSIDISTGTLCGENAFRLMPLLSILKVFAKICGPFVSIMNCTDTFCDTNPNLSDALPEIWLGPSLNFLMSMLSASFAVHPAIFARSIDSLNPAGELSSRPFNPTHLPLHEASLQAKSAAS